MKRTASIVALIALPSLLIAWGGIHLVLRERASVCAAVEGHESCSCGCQKLRSHANRMATEAGVAMLLLLILALCGAAAFAFDARRTRRQSAAHKAFVADISHDLKTPITVILANNSILRSLPEGAAAERERPTSTTPPTTRTVARTFCQVTTSSPVQMLKSAAIIGCR